MQPGDLISGKYRLQRQLGAGGMGSVWAARNELTDRDFAIKFLLPDLAQNQEALHRFFLEARACGQIKHPAIVDVYDMGQAEDGSPYLVMELLEGQGFDQRLAQSGVFPPVDAAAWIAFVARGLAEAHARGLVHRDLKPGNIFFSLDDRGDVIPKVLDFGVSKATGAAGVKSSGEFVKTTTGAVLGSPAYMSPEQAKGETDVDHRSDVWSLGVILYEALTAQVPFDAPNYNALMVKIMMQPHKRVCELNASVPVELSNIVDMALSKDRAQRIATANELAERLEAIVAQLGGNYPQFSPRMTTMGLGNPSMPSMPDAFGSMPNAFPSRPPPAMARANASTSGPWSDAAPTIRKPPRSRSLPWIVATMLATFLLAGTVFAYSRLSTPIAAVAGRSAAALTTNLSRVEAQLRQLEAEEAEAKAKAAAAAAAPAPKPAAQAGEPSNKPAASGRPSAGAAPRKKLPSKDPHGGVDSAGF